MERPLSGPNAPDFRHRGLSALTALFERPAGHVLEDYPEEAPADPGAVAGHI